MSLRAKIFAAMALTVFVMAAGMFIFIKTSVHPKLYMKLQKRAGALARQIAANSVNGVLTEKYMELQLLFNDMKEGEEDIVYIYFSDPRGNVRAHTFEGGFPEDLRKLSAHAGEDREVIRQIQTEQGAITDVSVPLFKGRAGSIHLGLTEASIMLDMADINRTLTWIIMLVFMSGSVLAYAVAKAVTKSLKELSDVVKAVAEGDMDRRFTVANGDEIGGLGRVFNEMLDARKKAETEREELIGELQQSLAQIKTLRGLVPICANCKRIRDDSGYWKQLEVYIREHSDAEFSHDICPDCARKLYPEHFEGKS